MKFSHTALAVGVEEDLLPLSALLHQRGCAHRIFEESGRQVLKVSEAEQVAEVEALYRAWRAGELTIELRSRRAPSAGSSAAPWREIPVTLSLIALSVCGFLVVYYAASPRWVNLLLFTPLDGLSRGAAAQPAAGEYWRLITPAFLHFGWLHIAFNSLWLWDLGGRVERVMGHFNMLGLFLVTALVSNFSQAWYGGNGPFGGMSGVVYGLLGFCWLGAVVQPRWNFRPPRPVMVFMLGWLLICLLGVVQGLGFGAVANAAHVGGLIAGLALGAAFGLLSRYTAGPV